MTALLSCSNSNNVNSTSINSEEEQVVNYSKLIKVTVIETGIDYHKWDYSGKIVIRLSVKNISNKNIDNNLDFKYRIIENGLIIDEASKTLQYRHLPPWNSGTAKLEILQSSIFKDIMNRNFSAEIYDDNNNLLWKGEIKKQIIDTLL